MYEGLTTEQIMASDRMTAVAIASGIRAGVRESTDVKLPTDPMSLMAAMELGRGTKRAILNAKPGDVTPKDGIDLAAILADNKEELAKAFALVSTIFAVNGATCAYMVLGAAWGELVTAVGFDEDYAQSTIRYQQQLADWPADQATDGDDAKWESDEAEPEDIGEFTVEAAMSDLAKHLAAFIPKKSYIGLRGIMDTPSPSFLRGSGFHTGSAFGLGDRSNDSSTHTDGKG